MTIDEPLLHQNSTRRYKLLKAAVKSCYFGCSVLPYLSCSTILAPNDFLLFSVLNQILAGKKSLRMRPILKQKTNPPNSVVLYKEERAKFRCQLRPYILPNGAIKGRENIFSCWQNFCIKARCVRRTIIGKRFFLKRATGTEAHISGAWKVVVQFPQF